MIQSVLEHPEDRLSNAVIANVLVLTVCRSVLPPPITNTVKSPFRQLFTDLQDMDVYVQNMNPIHAAGLFKLVQMKGIENVTTPGLAGMISS